jgi:hypothetical protein
MCAGPENHRPTAQSCVLTVVSGPLTGFTWEVPQQLARKRRERTSVTADARKRLAFQSLSVALQTANARMLRLRKALRYSLSSYLNFQDQRGNVEVS